MTAVGIDVGKASLYLAVDGHSGVTRFANSRSGIAKIVKQLLAIDAPHIVLEAIRGYEERLLEACCDASLWASRVNPGKPATSRVPPATLRRPMPSTHVCWPRWLACSTIACAATQPLLGGNANSDRLRRRGPLVTALQAHKQQAAMAPAMVRTLAARTIAALKRELAAVDAAMHALIKQHATPAMRSHKGLGPGFQASILSLLPELGQLSRRQIAKRVGVAPMNRDGGQDQGKRRIRGGGRRCGWHSAWRRYLPCVGTR